MMFIVSLGLKVTFGFEDDENRINHGAHTAYAGDNCR